MRSGSMKGGNSREGCKISKLEVICSKTFFAAEGTEILICY